MRTSRKLYTDQLQQDESDHLPEGNMVIKTLHDTNIALLGLCLFDSGSTSTLINVHAAPPHIKPKRDPDQQVTTTEGI